MGPLIFHDGAVGDVLLSVPCIGAIGRYEGKPDIVCRPDVGRLFRSSDIVGEAFSSDSSMFASWYSGGPQSAAGVPISRSRRIYVFTRIPDAGPALTALALPDTRTISTVPAGRERMSVAEFRLRQLPAEMQGHAPVRIGISAAVQRQAVEFLARAGWEGGALIVLHPGSGGKRKCWPLERFLSLAERLAEGSGAFILFLTGPAEDRSASECIGRFVSTRIGMAHIADADLCVVAGILASARLYVGNDSGITHVAAVVGAPVVALYGPTDPAVWGPRGAVRIVAAAAMDRISVDDVLDAAKQAGTAGRGPI